ncbi:isochorismatase [Desulfuromonas soudanensis]|uniref:nicotinamidase n=1 Tax=Desulfuromonas soudanensis TaxID=1603606 RepID=A0A0M4DGM7_9BACT|nr:nicotinamidase [Desulfuromonas soudanensis]ALC16062.1 isochorismatase [Desulfuromonas soudanensis]
MKTTKKLSAGDALLLVDVQKDFCPGGALPIEEGDEVVPILNGWIERALTGGAAIYASRDWHPSGHPSFAGFGGKWSIHCLQDSEGARFHPQLHLPATAVPVTKGVRFDQDQNSAFDQTGLEVRLRQEGIERLWIGGLALDVCVLATVLDACRLGFEVRLLRDGCRPVTADGGEEALETMAKAGAQVVTG